MGDLYVGVEAREFLGALRDERLAGRLWHAIGVLVDTPIGHWAPAARRRQIRVAGHRIIFAWIVREDATDLVYIDRVEPLAAERK